MRDCWLDRLKVGDRIYRVQEQEWGQPRLLREVLITKEHKNYFITEDKERFSKINSFLLYDNRGHHTQSNVYLEPIKNHGEIRDE